MRTGGDGQASPGLASRVRLISRLRRRWFRIASLRHPIGIALTIGCCLQPWHPGLALTLPASPAQPAAAAYAWRPVAVGGGGFITGYSADVTGATRVIRTDVYGGYIWEPASNRWRQLVTKSAMPPRFDVQAGMNEGVYEAVVAPSDPRRIYLAIKGVVLHSVDRGQHWVEPTGGAPTPLRFDPNSPSRHYGPFLAVSPANPNLVLLGSPLDGLWRSADGGVSWRRVVAGLPRYPDAGAAPSLASPGIMIWFAPATGAGAGTRVWAMVPGAGMVESLDAGQSFRPLGLPGTGAGAAGAGAGPQTIQRGAFGTDGRFYAVDGEHKRAWRFAAGVWEDITGRPGLGAKAFAAVSVDRGTGDIYLFDQGGEIWRSRIGGERWEALRHRATAGADDPPWLRLADQSYFAIGSVEPDPVTPGRFWAAAGTGVFYADVGSYSPGLTWTSQSRGIEELVANDVARPPGGPALLAGWDFGIHVKDDLDAFSTTFKPRERVLISAQQLDWSAGHPEFVVTNATDARSCCAEDGDAVMAGYSADGGRSWVKFPTLPTPPGTSADDPWRMSFGTIAVSATDTGNIVWEPSHNRSPFYTLDRGLHWARVVLPGEHLPDTGSHENFWMQRKTLAADRVAAGTFYLVHSGNIHNPDLAGVWRTTDGGQSWALMHRGEIAPQSQYAAKLRAVPGHAGYLFFTSGYVDDRDTALRYSTDGGAVWWTIPDVTHVDDIAFGRSAPGSDFPSLFISGRVANAYGIWRSDDTGRSWSRLVDFPLGRLDQVTVVAGDLDVFGRVYIGYQGSGWIYGEPSACPPAQNGSGTECSAALPLAAAGPRP